MKRKQFLLIIPVVLLILAGCGQPEPESFKISQEQVLAELSEGKYLVSPDEMASLLSQPSDDYRLIDIRTPAAFEKGNLEGSVNIPLEYLLDADYQSIWEENGVINILCGENELQANGPWMILRAMGFEKVKVLQGGYQYLVATDSNVAYQAERPRFDYAAIYQAAVEQFKKDEEANRPKVKPAPAPVARKIVPKKKKVVVEEEGC